MWSRRGGWFNNKIMNDKDKISSMGKLAWIVIGWAIVPMLLIYMMPDLAYVPIVGSIVVLLYTMPIFIFQNISHLDLIHSRDSAVYFSVMGAFLSVLIWLIILGILSLIIYKRDLKNKKNI
jgi:hypothetical protein